MKPKTQLNIKLNLAKKFVKICNKLNPEKTNLYKKVINYINKYESFIDRDILEKDCDAIMNIFTNLLSSEIEKLIKKNV